MIPDFAEIDEGDTVKAVVSDPTFTVMGTIRDVRIPESRLIIKEADAFRLLLWSDDDVPTLVVGDETYGKAEEIEVL